MEIVPDKIEWLELVGARSQLPVDSDEIALGTRIRLPRRMRGKLEPEEWKALIIPELIYPDEAGQSRNAIYHTTVRNGLDTRGSARVSILPST